MTTDFSQIVFDQANHTYRLGDQALTSVTKTISQFKPPFDRAYWAERKATERGVPIQAILDEWDAKAKASQERGTQVHQYIAHVLATFAAGNLIMPGPDAGDPFLGLNVRLPEMQAFDFLWQQKTNIRVEGVEWIIGDADLGIAGTVDALLLNTETLAYHLWDWKTGSKFSLNNRFQPLLHPFEDLEDCDLNNYSLQLSLYRLIVERNTSLSIGDAYLVYLPQDGYYQIYKALDLRDRLEQWLEERNK